MRYFELFDDMSNRMRHRWHIGEILLPDGTEPLFDDGLRLEDSRPLRAEVHHVGHVLEFCLTTFNAPIATTALANVIQSVAGEDVQCLPLAVAGQQGMMILNALRVIRCVNEQHSKFEKYLKDDPVRPDKEGQYRSMPKLVLKKDTIPADAHFFRVKDWSVMLIVSETLKNAMERVGCYGAKFIELETA